MGGSGYRGRRSQTTGGRGHGKPFNSNKTPTTSEGKKALMEFTPHTIGKHQTVTFDAVKEHILQKLQIDLDDGHDIVECLRKGINTGIPLAKPERIIE